MSTLEGIGAGAVVFVFLLGPLFFMTMAYRGRRGATGKDKSSVPPEAGSDDDDD